MLIGGGAVLGAASLGALFAARARTETRLSHLRPDPDGILDLPEGFTYRVVQRAGVPTDDGYRVPARPDGMACFQGADGSWVLMRNHENPLGAMQLSAFRPGHLPSEMYDPRGPGAVTRVVLDPDTLEVRSTNLVLAGTDTNCAGGPSPWGWLSCEESTANGHGYVFLCPIDAERLRPPHPLPGYGRFQHEAVAVDPDSCTAWLTEDQGDSCLYRFVPHDPERPFVGQLYAMVVKGAPRAELASGRRVGDRFDIEWLACPSDQDDLRHWAQERGAAVVRRGEGIFFSDGHVYFASTSGGPADSGQIFRLTPGADKDVLELVAQSESSDELDMPDNLTMAPWGDLIMAEDGTDDQFLRILTTDGRVVDLARNALSRSELTGPTFSPDGRVLFFNIQVDGLTLALEGPFRELTS